MTIIAYRDGIIAGDSKVSEGDSYFADMRKVGAGGLGGNRVIGGACGTALAIARFVKWLEDATALDSSGFIETEDKHFAAILVTADRRVCIYEHNGHYQIDATASTYLAIGCGKSYALGAMAHGSSAEVAARIACDLSNGCGGVVNVVSL